MDSDSAVSVEIVSGELTALTVDEEELSTVNVEEKSSAQKVFKSSV